MEMYFLKHPTKGFINYHGTFGSDERLYRTPKKVEWSAKIHYANTYKYGTSRVRFRDLIDVNLVDINSNIVDKNPTPSIEILRQVAFPYGYFDQMSMSAYDVWNSAKMVLGSVTDDYLFSNTPIVLPSDDIQIYRLKGFVFFENDEDVLMTTLRNPDAKLLKFSTILNYVDGYIIKELEGV